MLMITLLTIGALALSWFFDRSKTKQGVVKGLRMFMGMLPSLLNILTLVSAVLYLIPMPVLARFLGADAGVAGMSIAALLGSIAMVPGFISYPLASVLLKGGVAYKVIAVFITTLMMVGVVTLPLEAKYFGMRVAMVRNALSFVGALVVGVLIGLFL